MVFFMALAVILVLPKLASAQERLGDGAAGAVAGAIVGGPIGAIAGGVVGYTAGPAIAKSWGLKKDRRHRRSHGRARAH